MVGSSPNSERKLHLMHLWAHLWRVPLRLRPAGTCAQHEPSTGGESEAAAARPWFQAPCTSAEDTHSPAGGRLSSSPMGEFYPQTSSFALPVDPPPPRSSLHEPLQDTVAPTQRRDREDSPAENHDEVHDVPAIAEVRALVEDEPQGHDLDPGFKAKDPNEIGFRLLLWGEEQRCQSVEGLL